MHGPRLRAWAGDAALAAVLALWAVVSPQGTASPAVVGLGLLQTVPLAVRRLSPWPVLGVTAAAFAAEQVLTLGEERLSAGPLYLAVAVYTVARHVAWPWSLAAIALSVAAEVSPRLVTGRLQAVEAFVLISVQVAAWAAGSGQRRIRADAERLRELTRRLAAEREISTARAVTAERARIARDLHDVVAHHVSAIAVQSRAVTDVLADDPVLARDGARRIGETADVALSEMRRLLGLLATDPGRPSPEPSLRHLDMLTEAAVAAGCRVRASLDEKAADLPPAVEVCAYRIVQEALTNVLKHAGPVEVDVRVRVSGGELSIVVDNGPPAADHRSAPGTGLGLIGMRERAALLEGTIDAAATARGGWRVRVILPVGTV
ncbi:sensor histidine kinase [Spongiactinospora rosea]|uniref:histidine kinase n=1 Tax=Spongiactinospora rosea TaxID=2248750 RepID=A0A366LRZ4_9ACTN|nr:sensor histidine kinase [Spongiactinospora rosea]RBQ16706.1 sensor histidine kinase [Spongiactinospora rosea]